MQLKDSVVVITGGGQGLGRAMALYLAEKGARLALIDLSEEKLQESVAKCEELGAEARYYLCNVAKEAEVESVFSKIAEDFGGVDALINNAGILRDGMLIKYKDGQVTHRMSLEQWQSVIDVNLTGVFLCGREAAAKMLESGRKGCIINISSISRAGNIGQTNYSAAKAGVVGMSVSWAKELARFGIRCMAIAPGFIETEMTGSMKPEALEMMTKQIPLRRMGQPNEIAQTVCFILENDYLSGRVIEVDGALRI
ncbi:short-chain alcohol dehydrogenase-like protein [Hahella chejuensis KCTC 2396]|uniref:Short-chain alcohol dehydrogenase-like protein n=1 Tax=Hahella chejuensis (strain KCTC 2396) TaxID=349521 RepID=Q2SDF7_HAHCH|nr:SDR family oxidoreductase [Hahella chejuensis]ABC31317.1 short-chain alcohol dehydrogenase-like protein [Hahella chejuensis KCTC 2396]